ncbi:MAG: hypothetical protein KAJ19_23860 [Gammaproteobacteria bacterium]|nr:hypothetical protein [Gammaproteobacteria bacterium]
MNICKIYNWYNKVMEMTFEGEVSGYRRSKIYLSEFLMSTILVTIVILALSSWIIPLRVVIPKLKDQFNKLDVEFIYQKE